MKRAVHITVAGEAFEFDSSYEAIKERLDGYLEIAPTPGSPFVMFCDEEGKLKRKPFNPRANTLANLFRNWNDPLVGDVVLVGPTDPVGEDTTYTLAELEKVEARDAAVWAQDAKP